MGVGCKVADVFMGAAGFCYANPAKSKTKCIFVCGQNKKKVKPAPLVLDGKELPWVQSDIHLGHVLHESGSMDQDIKVKRATFIGESTK